MNRIFIGFFAMALCFAVGQALQCYDCKLGFWNLCFTTKTTCASGEQCFSGIGKAAKFMDLKMKGCLELARCNKTENINFPPNSTTQVYQMTKTCCGTDLCNSALGQPHVSSVSLVLATIASVLMVKFLI